jgi:acetyl-CoA carboxylase carboxyltransferase component
MSSKKPDRSSFEKNKANYLNLTEKLLQITQKAQEGGHNVKQHLAKGKMRARDRISQLIDPHSQFLELSPLAAYEAYEEWTPAAGLITGIGFINKKPVMIFANDATVKAGAYFPLTVKKHLRAQQIAQENALACFYLVDSAGAYLPLQESLFADQQHFGRIFFNQAQMSRQGIPQISGVFGPCTAGGAYIPAMSDESVIVKKTGSIYLAGPPLVKAAINETITSEELGGALVHTTRSGVTDDMAENEQEAICKLRNIAKHLNCPDRIKPNQTAKPPLYDPLEIAGMLPPSPSASYNVKEILFRLVDSSAFHEFKPHFGETLVCGFAHIWGYPIGIIANNGILFSSCALKATHFIQLCCQRNIPLLFLQNITGFMVGKKAEQEGITKHGAQLVMAVANAPVPKLTVIIGGSFGAGNYALCGRAYDPRFLWIWPHAQTAVMGAAQAAEVLRQLKKNTDLETLKKHHEHCSEALYSTSQIWDDGIILPWKTRDVLGQALSILPLSASSASRFGVFRM